ncbi:MAG: hypothetical protein NVS3B12_21480 [Acidimicrobiales bacterium]
MVFGEVYERMRVSNLSRGRNEHAARVGAAIGVALLVFLAVCSLGVGLATVILLGHTKHTIPVVVLCTASALIAVMFSLTDLHAPRTSIYYAAVIGSGLVLAAAFLSIDLAIVGASVVALSLTIWMVTPRNGSE